MAKKTRPIEWAESISLKTAETLGFEHLETVFYKEPAGLYLRIHLDKPGGITLSDCETFHRAVQPLLEQVEYDFLEVCSAGIDRPIKNTRDAVKAIGTEVEVKLFKPLDGKKEFTGTFIKLDEDSYYLQTEDGEMCFVRKDVALARRTVDLSVLEESGTQQGEETE